MLNFFHGLSKLGKTMSKKVKALHRICLAHIARILSRALFSLSLSSFILALSDFVKTASLYCAISLWKKINFQNIPFSNTVFINAGQNTEFCKLFWFTLKLKKIDISAVKVLVLDWTWNAWKFDLCPLIYFCILTF